MMPKFYCPKIKHKNCAKSRSRKKTKRKSSNVNNGYWINLEGSEYYCESKLRRFRSKLFRKRSVKHWGDMLQNDSSDSSFDLQIMRSIFNCSYCPYIGSDFTNLLKHVELTHLEKNDYRKSKIDLMKKRLTEIHESISRLKRKTSYFEKSYTNENIQAKPFFMHSRKVLLSKEDNFWKNENIISNNANSNINIRCAKKAQSGKQNVYSIQNKLINIQYSENAKQFNRFILNQQDVVCTGLKMTHFCLKCKREFHKQKLSQSSTYISSQSVNMCPECRQDFIKNSLRDPMKTYSSVCVKPSEIEDGPKIITANITHNDFVCPVCQVRCLTKTSLDFHLKITGHVENTIIFPECKATFSTKKSLPQHKSSTRSETFKNTFCFVCKQKFSGIELLKEHKQSGIHETMTYLCLICNFVFSKFEDSQKHKWKTGHTKFDILCTVCNYSFKSKHYFDHHIRSTGHNETLSSVPEGKYEKPNKMQHQTERLVYKKGSVLCVACRTIFSSKTLLERHIEDTGHENSVNFICSVCSASFETKNALDQHTSTVNHKNQTNSCTLCRKKFVTEKDLKQHMESSVHKRDNKNSSQKEFPKQNESQIMQSELCESITFRCSVCKKIFPSKKSLKRHIFQSSHTIDCPLCNATFTSDSALHSHIQNTTHKKNFPCLVCKKRFAKKEHLEQHMASNVHGHG